MLLLCIFAHISNLPKITKKNLLTNVLEREGLKEKYFIFATSANETEISSWQSCHKSIYTQTYTAAIVYENGEKRREEGKGKSETTHWFDYSSMSTIHETFAYVHAFL